MEFKMPKMPADTKPFSLGALAGAVLIAWVGFSGLGWKTSSAADRLIKQQAENAVIVAYARICSAHFSSASNLPVRLAVLEKTERWSRGDVLVKGGWATMAGSTEPIYGVSQACADLLLPEKS
ncbi:MAG: hypothetical protein HYU75_19530 [Betaproteobacteria bacterium]|nr:hypothetical protein [Betaproteobacteria bacterium]